MTMHRTPSFALAALLLSSACPAQMHKVAKPEQVVRAVGVYEWTGDMAKPTASRLIPVSLFIDDHLEDAGVYLSRPVPFALDTGTVYEVEQAGVAKGTVSLQFARHLVPKQAEATEASNDYDDGWFGYGRFAGPPKPRLAVAKKQTKPTVAESKAKPNGDADRPTFAHKPATSTASTQPSPPPASSTSGDSTDDDPDRPQFAKRPPPAASTSPTPDGQTSTGQTPPAASSTGSVPANDPDRPTLKKRTPEEAKQAHKAAEQSNVQSGSASLNDDPDRPKLARGRPAHPETAASFATLKGVPNELHQMVAVSDAKTREEHDFARAWEDDTERATTLVKLEEMARAQVLAYDGRQTDAVKAQVKAATQPATGSSAAATSGKTRAKRSPAQPNTAPTPALEDEQLKGYELSYGGAPTFVYTAHTVGEGAVRRYVTVVAQLDALGSLKPAIESVTDAAHLDRTPWMRLVDAVDAEASNRASLLFELRGDQTREFALYRVIAAHADQIFLTGATQ